MSTKPNQAITDQNYLKDSVTTVGNPHTGEKIILIVNNFFRTRHISPKAKLGAWNEEQPSTRDCRALTVMTYFAISLTDQHKYEGRH